MNARTTNTLIILPTVTELKRAVVQFARGASTEVSTQDESLLPTLTKTLPAGTTVYIAHPPKASLADVVRVALKVQALGLSASPHIVARRLGNHRALQEALRELREGDVKQALIVGGDSQRTEGQFNSTIETLATGYFADEGFERIGICGHPEGHKAIGHMALRQALSAKQEFAQRTGIKMHIVTQFGFSPEAVCAWDRHLTERGILLPVHVGMAGPTSLPKLIQTAMRCGVGNSLHALMRNLSAMSNLARLAISPDEMIEGIVRERATCNVSRLVQPHFFSFGGAVATANWLRTVINGEFEIHPDGGKFLMNS